MPQPLNIPAHEVAYGLNVDGDGTDIPRDETPDSYNNNISTKGELNKRPGVAKQNATSLGAYPMMHIGYFSVNNVIDKWVKINGGVQSI